MHVRNQSPDYLIPNDPVVNPYSDSFAKVPLKIHNSVLSQHQTSKERFERRQLAADLLTKLTQGKKNMRFNSLH